MVVEEMEETQQTLGPFEDSVDQERTGVLLGCNKNHDW
jgi:hypothetical protein